jgi:hypothetical protein
MLSDLQGVGGEPGVDVIIALVRHFVKSLVTSAISFDCSGVGDMVVFENAAAMFWLHVVMSAMTASAHVLSGQSHARSRKIVNVIIMQSKLASSSHDRDGVVFRYVRSGAGRSSTCSIGCCCVGATGGAAVEVKQPASTAMHQAMRTLQG